MSAPAKTKVIFRYFQGEVLAMFPAIAGDNNPATCLSYAHVGQHGAASEHLTHHSRLATPAEIKPLARELRRLGYRLTIGKRFSRADYRARLQQLGQL